MSADKALRAHLDGVRGFLTQYVAFPSEHEAIAGSEDARWPPRSPRAVYASGQYGRVRLWRAASRSRTARWAMPRRDEPARRLTAWFQGFDPCRPSHPSPGGSPPPPA